MGFIRNGSFFRVWIGKFSFAMHFHGHIGIGKRVKVWK